MSSRNTYVTSYIYSVDAIKVIGEVLSANDAVPMEFIGSPDHAGFFAGRLDTLGMPPIAELRELLKAIDARLDEIDYDVYFDIAVVCDDIKLVISRESMKP